MLTADQRRLLATKLADLGNLSVASLTFAALLREERLTEVSVLLGLLILVTAYGLSVLLSRHSS